MSRDRLLKQYLRERFVITLKSGETFDGLLNDWDAANVELLDAYAVGEKSRVAVDGRLYLPRDAIAYMQRPQA